MAKINEEKKFKQKQFLKLLFSGNENRVCGDSVTVWGSGNYIIGTATNDKVINSFTLRLRYTSLERFRFELDLFPKIQNDDRWLFQEILLFSQTGKFVFCIVFQMKRAKLHFYARSSLHRT